MEETVYTNTAICEESERNSKNIIEKLYQLQYEKESLKKDNTKLQCQLDSAEETIKECSARLNLLTQEVSSFAEAAAERNGLLEALDECRTQLSALKLLYEEQLGQNNSLSSELEEAKQKHSKLVEKMEDMERNYKEKDQQLIELVEVIREYEEIIDQRQMVVREKTDEVEKLSFECEEMRSHIRDLEEQWEFTQAQDVSNSNVGYIVQTREEEYETCRWVR
ncbi:unnamed protein product [Calicophoron daubneyi]|uniref:Uncharacterized protein n=1 Tax=Calicophoron daubneyi TaxID=300641 RepID=A0AAV2T6M1_CALDB